jgi:hypothetical protein
MALLVLPHQLQDRCSQNMEVEEVVARLPTLPLLPIKPQQHHPSLVSMVEETVEELAHRAQHIFVRVEVEMRVSSEHQRASPE